MPLLSVLDIVALVWFFGAWVLYSLTLSFTEQRRRGLNSEMHNYRDIWMLQMLGREMRMVDAQIVAALQNGTAFFASTSLIAIGGALTLLRSTKEILEVVGSLPFGVQMTPVQWELKSMGLAIIFVYAFFKFAWSYRLYNYVAILVGATPPAKEKDTPEAKAHAARVGGLCEVAGRHFNRGQRAFFFALGYLGWFISPWLSDGDQHHRRDRAVAPPVRVGLAALADRGAHSYTWSGTSAPRASTTPARRALRPRPASGPRSSRMRRSPASASSSAAPKWPAGMSRQHPC